MTIEFPNFSDMKTHLQLHTLQIEWTHHAQGLVYITWTHLYGTSVWQHPVSPIQLFQAKPEHGFKFPRDKHRAPQQNLGSPLFSRH